MNILAFDTATSIEIVAAMSEESVSDQTKEVSVSHSSTLFKSIDTALKETGIELKDLDVIGVGIGPGSFTGIRIAVSTARMFSQLFNLPIVDIKTHLIYASSASEKTNPDENILIAFDARKNRVFGALYSKNNEEKGPIETVQPGDYEIEYLINHIDKKENTILIGNGCAKFNDVIISKVPHFSILDNYTPSGHAACSLVKKIYMDSPEKCRDLNKVVPFYSRKPDAEIMKGLMKNKC